jgi:hypothetical protein
MSELLPISEPSSAGDRTELEPPPTDSPQTPAKPLSPLRCLVGAAIAGVMAFGMYLMMQSVTVSFAAHKITSNNMIVQRLSAAVRTLVVGLVTLGTGVFGFAALGLTALAIQLIWQKFTSPPPPSSAS